MKKRILILLVVVLALAATASVVWARGGGPKGGDVCWYRPPGTTQTEVRAIFYETNSGIVHEWRYSPEHAHVVFKPTTSFSEPDEGSWGAWSYTEQYILCGGDDMSDFLDPGASYWVQITSQ